MKSLLKSITYRTLANTGLAHRIHGALNRGQLSILMYHGIIDIEQSLPDWCFVDISSFHAQIKYLKSHFNIIPLTEAVNLLKHGTITEATAVITFDDGYQNNFDCAFPILCEEQVPATIFLATGLIDTDLTIWTGTLHNAFSKTRNATLTWRGNEFKLSSIDQKNRALAAVKSGLKKVSHPALMQELGQIISVLTEGESDRIEKNSPYRMLNSESILKMTESDFIEFGAHTHTHPILGNLSKQDQEKEILNSIEIVRSVTKQPCSFFAYPNGGTGDYDSNSISILEASGIEASLSTIEGTCDSSTPLMELKRFGIGSAMDMATFKLTVHNIINRMKAIS